MKKSNSNAPIALFGLALWMLVGVPSSVLAQASLLGLEPGASRLSELLTPRKELPRTAEMVLEGPVDPETFQLGPGDLLNIFLWRPTVTQFPVRINAEGEAVIPTVGPVKVTGISLSAAKEAILRKILERFSGAEVTVSLDEVRQFRVHVCGAVDTPGSYSVPATARVADAIFLAGGLLNRSQSEWDVASTMDASQRRIRVMPAQDPQATRSVDLLLFERAGDANANPYLHDGDVVWVPFREDIVRQVGVFGGVFWPGLFEYVPGDRVSLLIRLAGGAQSSARIFESYIVRADGERVAVQDTASLEMLVEPGDRLYVPIEPERQLFGAVTLKGEVARPGSYPIEIGRTTLRQVLQEAGGIIPTAAVNSARLVRAPSGFGEPERNRLLRARELGTEIEKTAFESELTAAYERWSGTTVVLDLSHLLEAHNSDGDIVLQDGDVLEIPKQPFGIRMLGCVNQSGETAYHPNWNLDDYLQAVGGINRDGWKSQTRVVKASTGSIVFYSSEVRLDPGDIIFVPSRPVMTTWAHITDGINVVAQIATVVFIVITASK